MAKKFFVEGLTVEQILSMDPSQMAKLDKRDISRALRTVALAANKRINRLLPYAKKTKLGYEPKTNAEKFIAVDALNWVTSDGNSPAKFSVKQVTTRNEMIAQISRIRQFMAMKTSTVTGAVQVRRTREKTLFGKTSEQAGRGKSKRQKAKTKSQYMQMTADVWSSYHKFRELQGQDPHSYYADSDEVLTTIAGKIFTGVPDDEAIAQTLDKMQQIYEETEAAWEKAFGDDWKNFGTFYDEE